MNQQPHLEFKLRACNARSVRRERGNAPKEPTHSPTRPTLPRLTRLLALAHRWDRLIEEGSVTTRAEIARLMGLTPARVTQIMDLLNLAPEIQEQILAVTLDGEEADIPERKMRSITGLPLWEQQRKRWRMARICPRHSYRISFS